MAEWYLLVRLYWLAPDEIPSAIDISTLRLRRGAAICRFPFEIREFGGLRRKIGAPANPARSLL
jgi:hypothetical protein